MRKVYELKKGIQIIYNDEILTFEEIRGDKAIFYNQWGEEFSFPDFLDIDEIGEIVDNSHTNEIKDYPTLF